MVELPEHSLMTLDEFRQTFAEKIAEAQAALADLNVLERRYGLELTRIEGVPPPEPNEKQTSALSRPAVSPFGARQPQTTLRRDHFLGLSALVAAKKYLELAGAAAEIETISSAVEYGGAAIPPGSKWKQELAISLGRSPDVIKIGASAYALTKFYTKEQIEAARNARRPSAKPKKTKGKVGRPRKNAADAAPKRRGRPPKAIQTPTLLERPANNSEKPE